MQGAGHEHQELYQVYLSNYRPCLVLTEPRSALARSPQHWTTYSGNLHHIRESLDGLDGT